MHWPLLPFRLVPDATRAPSRHLQARGLEANLNAVQMLIAFHRGARSLQEREGGHACGHHVLGDVALEVVPRLEEGLLRPRLLHAIDQHIHLLLIMVDGIVPRPGIDGSQDRIGSNAAAVKLAVCSQSRSFVNRRRKIGRSMTSTVTSTPSFAYCVFIRVAMVGSEASALCIMMV
jgi:hypothetical protein